MRSDVLWRARRTAVVLAVVTVSGCSAGQADGGRSARDRQSSPSAAVPAEPLTVERLASLTLMEGELPGLGAGGAPVREEQPSDRQRVFPPLSEPACQPLVDVRLGQDADAVVQQDFNWKSRPNGGSTIAAYRSTEEAKAAFARLEKAVGVCRSYRGKGWSGTFWATVGTKRPPRVGDEAVRFRETIPLDAEMFPAPPGTTPRWKKKDDYTVVRTGRVIAAFHDLGKDFPESLIATQIHRLRTGQKP
ncbi:hypothetical protein [Streptomyces jumonjinensis]|uniref:PknH-like extracellular domain-containing protein n=1 Tax=Streptomyces jumonjinensis TaxID=1945 RepID=A0A646KPY7_STRJU|nr:hypothetical protein [Streptomyces jumonjinensis]MQT04138.1 hypothetical protein [Streptomyces jumonjinensis]